MKKFNKTPKKTAVAIAESIADGSEVPQQSLLEKELVKQVSRKPLTNTSAAKNTTTVNNSNQSSVIVNYENNRKFIQHQSPQFVQNNQNTSTKDVPNELETTNMVDVIKREFPNDDPLSTHVKTEQEYESAQNYNGQSSDDNRVEQNSNSPIMLTTMQPVPIDHPLPMTAVQNEHPVQTQQDFLPDNEEQVQQFVKNGEMMLQDPTHIYQTVQQPFNPDSEHLVSDIPNGDLTGREVSQIREATQIIQNSASLATVPAIVGSPTDELSQEASKNFQSKRPIEEHTEYMNQNSILPGQLQDQQIDDPTQPQKTVIYLQSTTNENGQQTFIYDPTLQTQHIPTEIVSNLLQNSGLVSGGTGLVNLQDGSGGTTVLVLQEMPQDVTNGGAVTSGVVSSGDGNRTGHVGDLMDSDALTTAAGGMTTLSNVAASAMKIPTIVR